MRYGQAECNEARRVNESRPPGEFASVHRSNDESRLQAGRAEQIDGLRTSCANRRSVAIGIPTCRPLVTLLRLLDSIGYEQDRNGLDVAVRVIVIDNEPNSARADAVEGLEAELSIHACVLRGNPARGSHTYKMR